MPTNADEQAVSILVEGPVSENVNDSRPAATLNGVPTAALLHKWAEVKDVSGQILFRRLSLQLPENALSPWQ
jgi:hypothetical protein